MEILQGFIQPPKAQSADETIPTLCDRVENATLIGDRRSAILGLKSFSREYRETVVALGLKPLLSTLRRDYVDESSVKAILETLLILFIRGDGSNDLTRSWISEQSRLQNGKYPSPLVMKQEMETVDQFSLWIADAITQSEELVHLLIQLLETGNFHVRLYTIQILEALVATRPSRARKSITSLPTGVSTLVSLLDDVHDTVRDEMILLLMAVVNNSTHVQGLVAFENIFERLFSIIDEEGGLRGSIVVNDCLSLVHNILKYNTSNQTLFLETGNLPNLARILNEPLQDESFFWNEQRIKNINTALDIVTLTVEPGNTTTEKHQNVLLNSNIFMIVLRLVFYPNIPKRVRPVAVLTAADMVRDNETTQIEFSKIDVPFFDPSSPTNTHLSHESDLVPVIDLLVNWALYANSVHNFPTRMAAVKLLKSYLNGNQELQYKFLLQQIDSYKSGDLSNGLNDGTHFRSNLFEALLDYDPDLKLNPYKLYFTTDLLMYLFQSENEGNESLRELTRQVNTGNSLDDEESLSSIQSICELLITSLNSEDIRIPISYLTFLIFWLYGDLNATDDFLSNKSMIQSLLSFSYQVESEDDITAKCLVTILLGVSYEFSSKGSPFPRRDYFEFISKTLGRDNYLSRVKQFKAESLFAKAQNTGDVLDPEFDETGLPQVYFSPTFVTFFKENYYRVKSALTRSSEEEPCTKISFESYEEVRNQYTSLKNEMDLLELTSKETSKTLENEFGALNKTHATILEQYNTLQENYSLLNRRFEESSGELLKVNKSLKELNEERSELLKLKNEASKDIDDKTLQLTQSREKIEALEKELNNVNNDKVKAENGINKMNRELLKLTKENEELQAQAKQIAKQKDKQVQDLERKGKQLEALLSKKEESFGDLSAQLEKNKSTSEEDIGHLTKQLHEWKFKFQSHDSLVSKLTEKLKSLASSYKEIQSERDNLENKISSINSEHNDELTKLKTILEETKDENEKLSSRNKTLAAEFEALQKNLNKKSEEYNSRISSSLRDFEESQSKVGSLQVALDKMRAKELEDQSLANDMHEKYNNVSESMKFHEKKAAEAESRYIGIEKELQLSTEKVSSILKEKDVLEKQLEGVEISREEANERLASIAREADESRNSFQLRIKNMEGTINELREKNADLSSRSAGIQKELDSVVGITKTLEEESVKNVEKSKASHKVLEEECNSKKAEILSLKNSSEALKSKLEILQADLKEEKARNDSLEKKLGDFGKTQKEACLQLEVATTENGKLEMLLKDKEQTVNQLQQSIDFTSCELKNAREESNASIAVMTKKVENLQADLKGKNQEIERERKLLNQGSDLITKEYSEKVSQLEEKLNTAEQEFDSKSKELEIAKVIIEQLKLDKRKSIGSSSTEIESLKSTVEDQQDKISKAAKDLERLISSKEEELSELREHIKTLEKKIANNTESQKSFEDQIAKKEQLAAAAQVEISSLKQQIQSGSLEFGNLREKSSLAEDQIITLAAERDELKFKLSELEKKVQETEMLSREKQDLQNRLEIKAKEFSTHNRVLEQMREAFAELQKEKELLNSSNKSSQKKLASAEEEVLHLQDVVNEKDQILEHKENVNRDLLDKTSALKAEILLLKEKNQELQKLSALDSSEGTSEVDDLMLLVSDLDEKNAKYRAMLREHGLIVTSDEEDEDEESSSDSDGEIDQK